MNAPIVRNDGVVLNGNGRTAAIKYAYENGKAENYLQTLLEKTENFGIEGEAVAKTKSPILVREIVGEITSEDLRAIIESQTGGVRIGSSEQAKLDAEKIQESSLQFYVDNET